MEQSAVVVTEELSTMPTVVEQPVVEEIGTKRMNEIETTIAEEMSQEVTITEEMSQESTITEELSQESSADLGQRYVFKYNSEEEAETFIREYEIANVVHFVHFNYASPFKGFRMTSDDKVPWEDPSQQWRSDKYRLRWQMNGIANTGVPFLLISVKRNTCQHGQCKKNKIVTKNKSKKWNCPASVWIKEVIRFPDFSVSEIKGSCLKKRREESSRKLRLYLKNVASGDTQEPTTIKREFYVFISLLSSHNHVTGPEAGPEQNMDVFVKWKIASLVRAGIQSTDIIDVSLRQFVKSQLFKNRQLPDENNRRFYPPTKDLRNHISLTRRAIKQKKSMKTIQGAPAGLIAATDEDHFNDSCSIAQAVGKLPSADIMSNVSEASAEPKENDPPTGVILKYECPQSTQQSKYSLQSSFDNKPFRLQPSKVTQSYKLNLMPCVIVIPSAPNLPQEKTSPNRTLIRKRQQPLAPAAERNETNTTAVSTTVVDTSTASAEVQKQEEVVYVDSELPDTDTIEIVDYSEIAGYCSGEDIPTTNDATSAVHVKKKRKRKYTNAFKRNERLIQHLASVSKLITEEKQMDQLNASLVQLICKAKEFVPANVSLPQLGKRSKVVKLDELNKEICEPAEEQLNTSEEQMTTYYIQQYE